MNEDVHVAHRPQGGVAVEVLREIRTLEDDGLDAGLVQGAQGPGQEVRPQHGDRSAAPVGVPEVGGHAGGNDLVR
jgi:hypothetical protein